MKSKVLLDNATLSSAFRALGFAQCQNDSVFDLEISNLSNFVDAVLFNDEVYIPIDSYIPEHISKRKAILANIGINNLSIEDSINKDIDMLATNLFSRWCLDYKDDNTGLFNRLLELMDIYMRFVWNYRSSEYWLVMRAFNQYEGKKGGRIPVFETLLTAENREIWNSFNKLKSNRIIDSLGRELSKDKLNDHYNLMPGPSKIMAALAWNIYRSIYYRILAVNYELTYFPHSIRGISTVIDALSITDNIVDSTTLSKYGFSQSSGMLTDSFNKISLKNNNLLVEVGAIKSLEVNAIPPVLGYLLSKSNSNESFLENLYNLRNDRRIIDLRNELRGFELSVHSGDSVKIRKWKNKVEQTSKYVTREMGIEETRFNLNPISFITGGMISENEFGIKIPRQLNRIICSPNDWRLWYREVALTLQNVARLGDAYTKLKRWATFKDEEAYNWYSKNDYPLKYTQLLKQGIRK